MENNRPHEISGDQDRSEVLLEVQYGQIPEITQK